MISANSLRYQDRIIIDPEILVGKPVVRGTRIPVELVLKRLAPDLDVAALLAAYPRLTPEDIKACIEYADAAVAGEDVFLPRWRLTLPPPRGEIPAGSFCSVSEMRVCRSR